MDLDDRGRHQYFTYSRMPSKFHKLFADHMIFRLFTRQSQSCLARQPPFQSRLEAEALQIFDFGCRVQRWRSPESWLKLSSNTLRMGKFFTQETAREPVMLHLLWHATRMSSMAMAEIRRLLIIKDTFPVCVKTSSFPIETQRLGTCTDCQLNDSTSHKEFPSQDVLP